MSSRQHSHGPAAARAARSGGSFATCRASRATSMAASTRWPAPGSPPTASPARRVKPPTMRAPASPGTGAGASAPAVAGRRRYRASRISYAGDGVATAESSTPRSSSSSRTVCVKASAWVLSTHPSTTRSKRSRPRRRTGSITAPRPVRAARARGAGCWSRPTPLSRPYRANLANTSSSSSIFFCRSPREPERSASATHVST